MKTRIEISEKSSITKSLIKEQKMKIREKFNNSQTRIELDTKQ